MVWIERYCFDIRNNNNQFVNKDHMDTTFYTGLLNPPATARGVALNPYGSVGGSLGAVANEQLLSLASMDKVVAISGMPSFVVWG